MISLFFIITKYIYRLCVCAYLAQAIQIGELLEEIVGFIVVSKCFLRLENKQKIKI